MISSKTRLKWASRRLHRRLTGRSRPAILMYHRIGTESFDPWGMVVGTDRFERQIEWLSAHRTVLPLIKFAELHHQGSLPPDALSLTFDDGYACSATEAAPRLDRLGLRATVFIPAGLIESQRGFWWDELARIVLDYPDTSAILNGKEFAVPSADGRDCRWPAGSPPSTPRQRLYLQLWTMLRLSKPNIREAAMSQLRDQAPIGAASELHRPLRREEAHKARSALDFGSHALTHSSLPSLSHDEKVREIGESVDLCAAFVGEPPRTFAYPYGDFDKPSMRLVEELGFACGCIGGGQFVARHSSPFALPRLHVGDWEADRLANMLGHA